MERSVPALPGLARVSGLGMGAARLNHSVSRSIVSLEESCISGRGPSKKILPTGRRRPRNSRQHAPYHRGSISAATPFLAWPVSIAALCLGGLCWTLVRALPSRAQVQDLPEKWTVFGVPLELPDLSGDLTHSRDLPINAADALTATCKAGIDRKCASVTSSSFAKCALLRSSSIRIQNIALGCSSKRFRLSLAAIGPP